MNKRNEFYPELDPESLLSGEEKRGVKADKNHNFFEI
jgi:hypothetical protein